MGTRTGSGVVALALAAVSLAGCARPARAPVSDPVPVPATVPASGSAPRGPVADPPTPRLDADADVDEDLILARCLRADELTAKLDGRELPPEQRRQVDIGRRFVIEAREALERGDLGRADVLSEKALSLIEDVVRDR